MSKKIVVGLTGMPGSGKSQVLTILKEMGWLIVSSDEIAHKLLTVPAIQKKIFQKFPECKNTFGEVERRWLGEVIFQDRKRKKILEDILHPPIIRRLKKEIKRFHQLSRKKYLVVEVPLLFEKNLEKLFDVVVMVDAPEVVAFRRLKKARKWNRKYFRQVWASQISPEVKKQESDYVIDNSKENRTSLWREVKKFQEWIEHLP